MLASKVQGNHYYLAARCEGAVGAVNAETSGNTVILVAMSVWTHGTCSTGVIQKGEHC